MYRTQSEGGELGRGGSTSKTWWKLRRRNSSKLLDIRPIIRGASLPQDSNTNDHNLRPLVSSENQEVNLKQLLHLIQRMRPTSSSASNVDSAYKEFDKHKETCANLCAGILEEDRASRLVSTADSTAPRDFSIDSLEISGGTNSDEKTSYSGRSMSEPVNDGVNFRKGLVNEVYLNAMRDWRGCLESLCDAFRSSLADTYKSYERDATPEMLDLLFTSKKFRRDAVHRMRNASVTRMLSADPQFFPRYEIRFRNYERVKRELIEARQLLQSAESGILPTRQVQEFIMSPQGDAMLEFANHATGPSPCIDPVLRFRVSSAALANTSPIFARMFSGRSSSLHVHEAEDIQPCLPPSSTPYMCQDGTEVQLYRMPQYEINRLQSFEVLMHAAHMHTELVPNTVSFERFVAIAECSLRYKSTSPLERVVQESWLPQWMHRGADMPDGLLIISYAFGMRELFTRMSKRMILSLVDEKDLQTRPWPQKIRDKIWAVRCAKLDQIYACCTGTILEYLPRPTQANISAESENQPPSNAAMSTSPTVSLTTPLLTLPPRCPRGSHGCDAANLGWLLLNFNEMHLLPHILQPSLLYHTHASPRLPPRSLAHTIDISRRMPSPVVSPMHHSDICDPSLAFRAAIDDIHSSIHGLTLHDISGKSHGWALSKDRIGEPQIIPTTGLERMAAGDERPCAVVASGFEFSDAVRVRILAQVDDLGDLRALARINRAFFETYNRWEVWLARRFLQRGVPGGRGASGDGDGDDVRPCRGGRMEMEQKVRRGEVERTREAGRGVGDGVSVISFLTNDDDEGGEEEEEEDENKNENEDEAFQLDQAAGPVGSETPIPLSSLIPHFQPQDTELVEHPDEEAQHSSSDTASPTPLRYYPSNDEPPSIYVPRKSPGPSTIHLEEAPMTNEEARRILWPDSDTPDSLGPVRLIAPENERQREKFLAGDVFLTSRGGLEDKTLVGEEDGAGHLPGEIGLRAGVRAIRPADTDREGRLWRISGGRLS
ncbi:hypothetical protein E4U56_002743 [Claviceps arundinis]|uniref:BTB domain-containing protein n=1 Tax=Claviceps arundinis TaxID=1623583 RepID=A0A9P7MQ63_9HYPO|nr:hypothetical protein E4U56_002743 [Claviceps arundinis]